MGIEAISSTRMIVLMIMGGLFACVGLYMMLRPRPEGAAKVELFGLKFESSSAGLLVFLVGSAFLAVTLFVPEKPPLANNINPANSTAAPLPPVGGTSTGEQATVATEDSDSARPVAVSTVAGAVAKESEPNQLVRDADPLALSGIGTGKVGKNGDEDWWQVSLPTNDLTAYEVKVSHVAGSTIQAFVFDGRERQLGMVSVNQGSEYLQFDEGVTDKLFIKVRGGQSFDRHYELSVLPRVSQ